MEQPHHITVDWTDQHHDVRHFKVVLTAAWGGLCFILGGLIGLFISHI